jgi:EmrB/QacA subfamily drug resistance transporter
MFSSPSHPNKALTLLAVCLGSFMLIIDVQIVVVALPSIRADLHTSLSDEQWTVDAYALSLAALLLPTGSLADILGRRRIFAVGLACFTIGSLLCGIAGSGIELVIFRALQGIGGAMVFSTSLALLVQTFEGRERGLAIGVWSAVISLGLGCGPVLGGLLTEVSWRWIFFVNLPLGVIAVLMTLIGVQEVRRPGAPRIDLPGGGVFTLGLVGLIYGLIESGSSGWGSAQVIAALTVAVVALVSFPLIERVRRQPMFDLSLLRKPTFVGGLAAALGMNGSLYAVLLYLVLYLQNGLRTSALDTGLELLVITVTATATSVLAGRLQHNVPVRLMIGLGLGLIGLGLLLMRGLSGESDWKHLIVGMAIAGVGSGFVNTPLASTAVGVVRPDRAGMASGINATFRQVGIATAVAVLGSIFDSRIGRAVGTAASQYAAALDAVLLVAACIAFGAGGLAFVLIRRKDFYVPDAKALEPEPAPATATATTSPN